MEPESVSDNAAAPHVPDFTLVHRLLREGGGEVWLGRSLTGVYRAVRVLPRGPIADAEIAGIRLFQRVARRHPNLVEVLHVGQTDTHEYAVTGLADSVVTVPAFAYEKYEPRTLRTELERRGRLPVPMAVEIALAILRGLHQLHVQGVVYGALSPENVVYVDGEIRLREAGSVALRERPVTSSGREGDARASLRSPDAPRGGVVGPSEDLLAAGRLVTEMLTGAPRGGPASPREGSATPCDDARRLRGILRAASRGAAGDSGSRFASAAEMAAAIERAAGRSRPLRPRVTMISSVALLAAAVAAAWWGWSRLDGARGLPELPEIADPAGEVSGPNLTCTQGLFFPKDRYAFARCAGSEHLATPRGLTLELWVEPVTLRGDAGLLGSTSEGPFPRKWLVSEEGSRLAFQVNYGETTSPPMLEARRLQHIAVAWDPAIGSYRFYRDGVLWGTDEGPLGIGVDGSESVGLGIPPPSDGVTVLSPGPDAALAEVRLWNRPRTEEEIFRAFDRPLTATEIADTSLVAYWPLNEGAGQVARDATGHGHDLSLGATAGPDSADPVWLGPLPLPAPPAGNSN